jgi:hypothetical protein
MKKYPDLQTRLYKKHKNKCLLTYCNDYTKINQSLFGQEKL